MKYNPLKTRKGRLENKIELELVKTNPDKETILQAVCDFEADNIATIDKFKKAKDYDTKKISGALKQCINTHGPITKQFIGSATKRIYGALITDKENESATPKPYYRFMEFGFYILVLYNIIRIFI